MDNTLHIGERKWELETARRIVHELADLIRPACERLEVVGSIRRGSPMVKDAELVAIPGTRHTVSLLELTDDLVARGIVEKALYGNTQTTKWGEKYRGMLYQGMKVELFLADEINWGFQRWLRSGPGEANHYIMAQIIYKRASLRFVDGYGWHSPGNLWQKLKDKWVAADKVQLNIPDEDTLFALLGMPYIPPNERSEYRYKQLLQWNRAHRWPDFTPFIYHAPEPVQPARLVEAEERYRVSSMQQLDKDLRWQAELAYHQAHMTRHNAIFERARRGEKLLAWEQRIVCNRIERTGGWL